MHLKRWITGIVVLPLLFLLIYKGGALLFAVLISIVCILALWEYLGIVFSSKGRTAQLKAQSLPVSSLWLLALITGLLIIWAAYKDSSGAIVGLITLNFIVSGIISLSWHRSTPLMLEKATKQICGIVYIPVLLSYIILIRNGTDGATWIFLLVSLVFAGDIGAYYAGSYLGRHKLCPTISPKKTVEGSIGGLIANFVAGSFFVYFFLPLLPWSTSILFFLVIGIAGQVGDLFESILKRSVNLKDSGVMLPGYGGLLDRVDSMLFAAPVAYLFKEYIFY